MFENVKTIKNKLNEEIEVYYDTCIICEQEMLALKVDVDKIKEKSEFVYKKLSSIPFCQNCFMKKKLEDPNFELFSAEELEEMKKNYPNET